MPADLDEIFADLRAEADFLPLSPPDAARRDGTRRTRSRALVAVVAAVACIAGGSAWFLKPATSAHRLPATTTSTPASPAPHGSDGASTTVTYGLVAQRAFAAVDGNQAYAAWQREDGSVFYLPAGKSRGVDAYLMPPYTKAKTLDGLLEIGRSTVLGYRIEGSYTVTGVHQGHGMQRWMFSVSSPDDFVLYEQTAVYRDRVSGRITGLDISSGKQLWQAAGDPGADAPLQRMGDFAHVDRPGSGFLPPIGTTAPGTASLVTFQGGRAVLRVPETGAAQPAVTVARAARMIAYAGSLFSLESSGDTYLIRATTLDTRAQQSVIRTGEPGHTFETMTGCGEHLLCVADAGPGSTSHQLSAVDLTGEPGSTGIDPSWTAPVPDAVTGLSVSPAGVIAGMATGSAVFRLPTGVPVASGQEQMIWANDRDVLVLPSRVNQRLERIDVTSGSPADAGSFAAPGSRCAAADGILACANLQALRAYPLS